MLHDACIPDICSRPVGTGDSHRWLLVTFPAPAYLLKNRGIRKLSDLPPGVVPPNFGVPCCRGIDI